MFISSHNRGQFQLLERKICSSTKTACLFYTYYWPKCHAIYPACDWFLSDSMKLGPELWMSMTKLRFVYCTNMGRRRNLCQLHAVTSLREERNKFHFQQSSSFPSQQSGSFPLPNILVENYFFLENHITSKGAVPHNVLYYQQLPITRYTK